MVLGNVQRRLAAGSYDFVFTLFPSPETHGAHKAATITALNAVQQGIGVNPSRKPVVLGCQDSRSGELSREQTQPSWQGFQSAASSVSDVAAGVCDRSHGEVWIQERA